MHDNPPWILYTFSFSLAHTLIITMAVKVYHDSDADLSIIQNKRVTFVGYGNQGKIAMPNCMFIMQPY